MGEKKWYLDCKKKKKNVFSSTQLLKLNKINQFLIKLSNQKLSLQLLHESYKTDD